MEAGWTTLLLLLLLRPSPSNSAPLPRRPPRCHARGTAKRGSFQVHCTACLLAPSTSSALLCRAMPCLARCRVITLCRAPLSLTVGANLRA